MNSLSNLKNHKNQLIMNRSDDIDTREIAGHWGGDLIVGAMNKSVSVHLQNFLRISMTYDGRAEILNIQLCLQY